MQSSGTGTTLVTSYKKPSAHTNYDFTGFINNPGAGPSYSMWGMVDLILGTGPVMLKSSS